MVINLVMVFFTLMIQKPSQKSKTKTYNRHPAKRLGLWKDGKLSELSSKDGKLSELLSEC